MGSLGMIVAGVAAMVGSFLLLQHLRPLPNRPAPAWAQNDTMSTLMSLAIVVGAVFGLGMIIAGALS